MNWSRAGRFESCRIVMCWGKRGQDDVKNAENHAKPSAFRQRAWQAGQFEAYRASFEMGFSAKIHSRIGLPSMRCSFTKRGIRSAVMPWYQVPSGYTSIVGPWQQMRKQPTLVR